MIADVVDHFRSQRRLLVVRHAARQFGVEASGRIDSAWALSLASVCSRSGTPSWTRSVSTKRVQEPWSAATHVRSQPGPASPPC